MQVRTIPLKDFDQYVENLYEAIIIIAKRARQINDEQKTFIEAELPIEDDDDYYNEEHNQQEEEKNTEIHYIKLPKPTQVALGEMLAGKLKFEYLKNHVE